MPDASHRLMDTVEAAARLGCHRRTITRLVVRGVLEPVYRHPGGAYVFDADDIEDLERHGIPDGRRKVNSGRRSGMTQTVERGAGRSITTLEANSTAITHPGPRSTHSPSSEATPSPIGISMSSAASDEGTSRRSTC